jgi:hypothetical protein
MTKADEPKPHTTNGFNKSSGAIADEANDIAMQEE